MNKFVKLGLITAVVAGTGLVVATTSVDASSKPMQLRYFENFLADGSRLNDNGNDSYLYRIGYIDDKGKSRRMTKLAEHVQEYITDTGKATVSYTNGDNVEVVRPPYQSYDVDVKSNDVTTVGWTDFVRKHPDVKGKTLPVKWHEVVSDYQGDNGNQTTVIEFAYNRSLYRMYLTVNSNGMNNYNEDVSPSYDTPTLKFDKSDGHMTYQYAPYNMYTQAKQSGTVTEK